MRLLLSILVPTEEQTTDTQCSETATVLSKALSREAVAVYIIIHTEEQTTDTQCSNSATVLS